MKYFMDTEEKVEIQANIKPISRSIINILDIPKSYVIWNDSYVKYVKTKAPIPVIMASIY